MTNVQELKTVLCGMCVLVAAASAGSPAPAGQDKDFGKLIEARNPALVTVKFVLKLKGSFGDMETESELTGVMVRPNGLIVCSNSQLGGPSPLMRRMGATATPRDLKILIGDDSEGIDAKVIARDSELDLTWLQIKDAGERKFAFIDLSASADVKIGDPLLAIVRMDEYFGRAPVVRAARVGGTTAKPRRLLVPSGPLGDLGSPVFDKDGRLVGISVAQLPESGGGPGARSLIGLSGLILPAAELQKATTRALEVVAEDEGE